MLSSSTSGAQKGASVGTGRGTKDSSEQLDVRIATAEGKHATRDHGHSIVIPGRRRAIEQESARMTPLSEAQQLETLLELQRDLAFEASIDKVLWRITLAATFMLDADRATLYVVDHAKNELWSRALTEGGERGESVAAIREIRLPLDGRSLAAEVARTGELPRIDEPYEDPRFDPSVDARTGDRTRSILRVPIDSR